MRKIIHRLRQRPEEEKRQILHISIIIIAIALIVLWVFSLNKTLSTPETKEKFKNDLKPFSILKNNLSEGFKNVSE